MPQREPGIPQTQAPDTVRTPILERTDQEKEKLEEGVWVEMTAEGPAEFADTLEERLGKAALAEGFVFPHRFFRGKSAYATVRSTLENAFKSGLKFPPPKTFKVRMVAVHDQKEKDIVAAMGYEFAVQLTPRYQKDGNSGEYVFRFFTKIKLFSDADKATLRIRPEKKGLTPADAASDKIVFVSTAADARSKQVILAKTEAVRQVSEDIWASVIRERFVKPLSAGAPGLGKK